MVKVRRVSRCASLARRCGDVRYDGSNKCGLYEWRDLVQHAFVTGKRRRCVARGATEQQRGQRSYTLNYINIVYVTLTLFICHLMFSYLKVNSLASRRGVRRRGVHADARTAFVYVLHAPAFRATETDR